MERAQQGHEISDEAWAVLAPALPGQRGKWGRIARDNRQFLNGVLWILGTGAPWRELPARYGNWAATYRRFRRWQENGTWASVYGIMMRLPEFAWLKEPGNFQRRLQATKSREDARKGTKTEQEADDGQDQQFTGCVPAPCQGMGQREKQWPDAGQGSSPQP